METTEQKHLVLAQQGGIVITALATLGIAGLRIFKTLKADTTVEPTE